MLFQIAALLRLEGKAVDDDYDKVTMEVFRGIVPSMELLSGSVPVGYPWTVDRMAITFSVICHPDSTFCRSADLPQPNPLLISQPRSASPVGYLVKPARWYNTL